MIGLGLNQAVGIPLALFSAGWEANPDLKERLHSTRRSSRSYRAVSLLVLRLWTVSVPLIRGFRRLAVSLDTVASLFSPTFNLDALRPSASRVADCIQDQLNAGGNTQLIENME